MSAATGVQKRSIVKVLLLSFITFGLYGIYVTHKYHTEFAQESSLNPSMSPVIRTVLMLLGPLALYSMWLFYKDVESLTGESAVKLLVLSFVFVGWIMALSALNDYAS